MASMTLSSSVWREFRSKLSSFVFVSEVSSTGDVDGDGVDDFSVGDNTSCYSFTLQLP